MKQTEKKLTENENNIFVLLFIIYLLIPYIVYKGNDYEFLIIS